MGFMNPWMLAAMGAVALPVLIHLISKRRLHRIPFAPMRYLLLAHNRLVRRNRLRQWLLLALRMAAVALLALFVAHPVFSRSRDILEIARQSEALVLILDNSLSMGYLEGNMTRLDRGRKILEAFLQGLAGGHRMVLLATNPATKSEGPLTLGDRAQALAVLKGITFSYGTADIPGVFQQAYQLLAREKAQGKSAIVVVTDLGRNGWDQFNPGALRGINLDIPVTLVDLAAGASSANRSVQSVEVARDPMGQGTPSQLKAVVANFSTQAQKAVPVSLWVGSAKLAEQLVDLEPGERRAVNISFLPPAAGLQEGRIELGPDDLSGDDRLFFPLNVSAEVKVLVVDGDPRPSLSASETYYLTNALHPEGVGERGLIGPRVVTPKEIEGISLKDYGAVILANVESISPEARSSLFRYLWDGGGLIFFLGDKVEPQRYNRDLFEGATPLLPVSLAEIKTAVEKSPFRITRIDVGSPIVEIFRGPGQEAFRNARFSRYFRVESRRTPVHSLLEMESGDPLLLEASVGRGKVLLFTSSADLDWNNLPATSAYLPLFQQAVLSVTGRLADQGVQTISWGTKQEVVVPVSGVGKEARLREPGGRSIAVPIENRGDKAVVVFQPQGPPGIYRLEVPGSQEIWYGVNPPAAESDLTPVDLAQLKQKAGGIPLDRIAAPAGKEESLLGTRETDFSPWFLLVLGGVLAAEAFVAHRN
ncbi:MAG: BatA domain-containing protein [Candidatus Tectomicrobia bacterium]|uniref:BatA domain-containing protein n=1 Tax=Tectimicrobiota bacterium TaxID=2528274 RepID=A0A932M1A1_UNCTE|nr:BatA domain-containing protein [Candidatus Tectomicrobia bacterium]